jgi:hydrogenase maturation protein HypF
MSSQTGLQIHITGVVQGVGFRPFIYGLATRFGLTGWVRNTSAGVDIQVDGEPNALQAFVQAIPAEKPPLARLDEIQTTSQAPGGFTQFEILASQSVMGAFQPISPDVCTCPDCLRELFDPQDRRYRYPFINCTNCGPRFTIIEDVPYDRPKTTMAGFPMCPACAAEYHNPADRRFHAQPVACPDCGPQIWLEIKGVQTERGDAALLETQRLLAKGDIIAIKGLGGFHLACDATQPQAVEELRRRKLRVDKPFALMLPDLAAVEAHCRLNLAERQALTASERPIVIAPRRPDSPVAAQVAPGQQTLGVMLPYTPLHYLLFANHSGNPAPSVLVMTSGNLNEEPIAFENAEAGKRLANLADAFLLHNRPIRTRCDDSVVRCFPSIMVGQTQAVTPLRRARGYAPHALQLPWNTFPLLATGTELKNTFCLARERYAFLSHHIGDMENYETLRAFEDGIEHFERLFHIQPRALAYDLHPDYLATRYALVRAEREHLPAIGIQHHHAHIAACLAEHGLAEPCQALGVAFDGTGYGTDGAIWGGEFFLASYRDCQRLAHLRYTPLPGGNAAIRQPARTALAHLWQAGLDWPAGSSSLAEFSAEERTALHTQLERRLNAPLTSSMGRLFDAVAALTGVRQKVNYEAQAAIEFEALVDEQETASYPFEMIQCQPMLVDPAPLLEAVLGDLQRGVPTATIAARFHNGVAEMVVAVIVAIRRQATTRRVVLSGGVWQNLTLLKKTIQRLHKAGFEVYTHSRIPPNDGGVALGQAAIAFYQLQSKL